MPETDEAFAQRVIDLLRHVRQVRRFTETPVPRPVIDAILEVGRWSGSSRNLQPWDLVLVQNRDTLRAIADAEGQSSHLGGATFGIIIALAGSSGTEAAYDEGRLTERLMAAAEAYGVGAGIWWFRDGGAAAKQALGIPEDRTVRSALSFGYPAEAPAGTGLTRKGGRRPLSDAVHEEHF